MSAEAKDAKNAEKSTETNGVLLAKLAQETTAAKDVSLEIAKMLDSIGRMLNRGLKSKLGKRAKIATIISCVIALATFAVTFLQFRKEMVQRIDAIHTYTVRYITENARLPAPGMNAWAINANQVLVSEIDAVVGEIFDVRMEIHNPGEGLIKVGIGIIPEHGLELVEDSVRLYRSPNRGEPLASIENTTVNIGTLAQFDPKGHMGWVDVRFQIRVAGDIEDPWFVGSRLLLMTYATGFDMGNNVITDTVTSSVFVDVVG